MFLDDPATPEAAAYLDAQRASTGYVMNLERAWAWRPDVAEGFQALRQQLMDGSTLSPRELAVLVCSGARALGDSYCAIAWGSRLASLSDPQLASDLLRGVEPAELTVRESALRGWAEQLVMEPNSTRVQQVARLRAAGLSDREIFEASVFVALRLAFSTVNGALGAQPDAELLAAAPPQVRDAVTYGRQPAA